MNLYDITVSVRIRCQATQVGDAQNVVVEGVTMALVDWVKIMNEGLPNDADKPMALEDVSEFTSERVVTAQPYPL